jgi:hypothetical protein
MKYMADFTEERIMADKEFNADVSGIDERSEARANEMEEAIWRNGGAVKIGIPEKGYTRGERAMNTEQDANVAELEKAADAGDVGAMIRLGDYYSGAGSPGEEGPDLYKATVYYHKAEKTGAGEEAEYAHTRNRQLRYDDEAKGITLVSNRK